MRRELLPRRKPAPVTSRHRRSQGEAAVFGGATAGHVASAAQGRTQCCRHERRRDRRGVLADLLQECHSWNRQMPLVSPRFNGYVCAASARAGHAHRGEVAEWLNAPHSKCGILARVSGVRIPPSPPVPGDSNPICANRLFRLGNLFPQLPTGGDGRWTDRTKYRPKYRRTYRWTYRLARTRGGPVLLLGQTREAIRPAGTSSGQGPFIFSRSGCPRTSAERPRATCASGSVR